jgi:hypothetical protein
MSANDNTFNRLVDLLRGFLERQTDYHGVPYGTNSKFILTNFPAENDGIEQYIRFNAYEVDGGWVDVRKSAYSCGVVTGVLFLNVQVRFNNTGSPDNNFYMSHLKRQLQSINKSALMREPDNPFPSILCSRNEMLHSSDEDFREIWYIPIRVTYIQTQLDDINLD